MKNYITLLSTILLSGSLFGQAEVKQFLPDLFADMPYVRDLAITGNGDEMYFTVDDYKHKIGFLVRVSETSEGWSEPEVLPFSGRFRDIEPALSLDGNRLYFASNRPLDPESNTVKDYDIYYVERDSTDAPWGDPVRLPEPINTEADEYYPSLTDNNDLYFTSAREGGIGGEDIYESAYRDSTHQEPIVVGGGVNTESYEYNAFVSPDGSYLIFSSYREREGRKRNDLYISRRGEDGIFGDGVLLPLVFSDAIDYCPYVERNSNKFYFTSERSDIEGSYSEALDFESFMEKVSTGPSGLGRIYTVDFSELLKLLD